MSAETTWTANPVVNTLAEAVANDPNVRAEVWGAYLEMQSNAHEDISKFEGPDRGSDPIYLKRELGAKAGAKINFTAMSQPFGPGVRGEQRLKGHESKVRFKTWSLMVDYWRDALALTEKEQAQLAAGGNLRMAVTEALAQKAGLQRQADMLMTLIHLGVGNTIRPNGRRSLAALTADDTLDMGFIGTCKTRATTLGAKPMTVQRDPAGGKNYTYLFWGTNVAIDSIRNDPTYGNALMYAADRGVKNPLYNGQLVPVDGCDIFRHLIVDPDADDVIGSPLAPKVVTAVAIAPASGTQYIQANTDDTAEQLYTQWFPGYAYRFRGVDETDSQAAVTVPVSAEYYAWGVTPEGKVGFIAYNQAGNNGKRITITKILSNSPSNQGETTVGNLHVGGTPVDGSDGEWEPGGTGATIPASALGWTYTDTFPVGTVFFPANENGVTYGRSFLFGKGAAGRAYGSIKMAEIADKEDYGFVSGWGWKSIFGQGVPLNTAGISPNYLIAEHAIVHEGWEVPSYVAAHDI